MSDKVKIDVSLKNDTIKEIKDASDEAIEKALEAVGLQAVGYAQLLCPVDTGRLRNSLVYATNGSGGSLGGNNQPGEHASGEDVEAHGTPEKGSVVIGTNVEYAEKIELGGSKQAPNGYLGPAIQNHIDEYRRIIEEMLKE